MIFKSKIFTRGLQCLPIFLFLAFLLWLAGFGVFLQVIATKTLYPTPTTPASAIFVLTGGGGRIEKGFRLFAEKKAPLLLISGVDKETTYAELARLAHYPVITEPKGIVLGFQAKTTYGNALTAAFWAKKYHLNSLIVVTANYHMPRALWEIHQADPNLTLYPDPVADPDRLYQESFVARMKLLSLAYTKYLAARVGLSRFAVLWERKEDHAA